MKKKFIAVYALIGVLALGSTTLTSCVDDNESASVTAVRDAKAAQLNALAKLSEAQATYNEGLAAVQQAIAANQLLENERYEAEIEKLKAEYEKDKALAEQALVTNLQDYQETLYGNYTDAQDNVNTIMGDIIDKQLEIVSLQADSADLRAIAANNIHDEQLTIAKETAKKEAYQAMGNNSYDELVKQSEQLSIEKENKEKEKTAKQNARTAAKNAFNNAKALNVDGGSVTEGSESTNVKTPLKTVEAINALNKMYYSGDITKNVIKDGDEIKVSEDALYSSYSYTLQVLDAPAVTVVTNELQDEIDAANKAKGDEKDEAATPANGDAAYTDYDNITFAYGTTAYAKLNYFVEAEKEAREALKDAKEDDADYATKQAAARKTAENLGYAQDRILAAADEVIKEAEDVKAEFEAQIALLDTNSEDYKAYKTAVESLINNEGKAYIAADEAYKAAELAYVTAVGEYNAVQDLVGNNGTVSDINALIGECDENITKAQSKITKYENLLGVEGNNYADSKQALLAEAKSELQNLKDELAIAEAQEAAYKEQLEASLNGTTTSVPETPAEGEGATEA